MKLTINQILLLLHIYVGTDNKYKCGTKENDLKVLKSLKLIIKYKDLDIQTTVEGVRFIENMQNLFKYNELGLTL